LDVRLEHGADLKGWWAADVVARQQQAKPWPLTSLSKSLLMSRWRTRYKIIQFSPYRRQIFLCSLFFATVCASLDAHAENHPFITIASTTSAEQPGLLGYLLPIFTRTHGIDVLVVRRDVSRGPHSERPRRGYEGVLLGNVQARCRAVHYRPADKLF
jgi:hypothetical protein